MTALNKGIIANKHFKTQGPRKGSAKSRTAGNLVPLKRFLGACKDFRIPVSSFLVDVYKTSGWTEPLTSVD
jgi:hypothetical protein